MTTTKELNNRWWYRLVKVVYILALVFSAAIVCLLIFSSITPQFDSANSYVICGNYQNHVTMKDAGVTLYDEYISPDNDTILKYICANTKDLGTAAQEAYPNSTAYQNASPVSLGQSIQLTYPQYNQTLNQMMGFVPDNYTFVPVYTPRNWPLLILYLFIGILCVVLVFEIIRRIFYYIVLGRLRPR
jgi:hypothetical protein